MILFKYGKKNYYFYTNIEILSSNILSSKIYLDFVFLIIYHEYEYIFRNACVEFFMFQSKTFVSKYYISI